MARSEKLDARACRLAALAIGCLVACTSEPAPRKEPTRPKPDQVTFAGDGDPRAVVVAARTKAEAEGRTLLLYVGAPWCEPCTRFHDALLAGKLDADLAGLRFLELDHDAQAETIEALGCTSKMIPLVAVPDADGKCTEQRIEGGIKGEGAVAQMVPRVRALVPAR